MAPAPRRELEEKKSSYTLGSPTTGAGGGDQPGQRRSFRVLKENTQLVYSN